MTSREKELAVYFQSIGVLVSYNIGLTSVLNEFEDLDVTVDVDNPLLLAFALQHKLHGGSGKLRPMRLLIGPSIGPLKYYMTNIQNKLANVYGKKLCKIFLKKFDLLHLNYVDDPLFDEASALKKPKILTLHYPMHRKQYEKLSQIDAVVTPSHFEARKVKERANIECIVIHHGVETSFFNTSISQKAARMRLKLPFDAKIVLWSNRISIYKDLGTLLKAVPLVVKEVPEVMFLIHGRTVEKTYLDSIRPLFSQLHERYNRHLKIKFGWFPYLKMPRVYRAADLYVHTSRYETFGLGLVEAMACGVPVIAANGTAGVEVLGNTGKLFRVGDHEDLANQIASLLKDDRQRSMLSRSSVKRVQKNFTWDTAAKKYHDLYMSTLSR